LSISPGLRTLKGDATGGGERQSWSGKLRGLPSGTKGIPRVYSLPEPQGKGQIEKRTGLERGRGLLVFTVLEGPRRGDELRERTLPRLDYQRL